MADRIADGLFVDIDHGAIDRVGVRPESAGMAWVRLCDLGELVEGKGKFVEAGGLCLAVFLEGGRAFVMNNYCPHAGGSLAAGFVEDGCAVCPWHYWKFRLADGQLASSAHVKVETYPARVVGGGVEADLPQEGVSEAR